MNESSELVNTEKRKGTSWDGPVWTGRTSMICPQPLRDDATGQFSAEPDTLSPILSHRFLPLWGDSKRDKKWP